MNRYHYLLVPVVVILLFPNAPRRNNWDIMSVVKMYKISHCCWIEGVIVISKNKLFNLLFVSFVDLCQGSQAFGGVYQLELEGVSLKPQVVVYDSACYECTTSDTAASCALKNVSTVQYNNTTLRAFKVIHLWVNGKMFCRNGVWNYSLI